MPVSRRASRPASTVTIRSRCALLTIAVDGHRCLHTYATCFIIFFVTHGARGWRHRVQIDYDSGEPVYLQIARLLRDQIIQGELQVGAQLPSGNEMQASRGVTRVTYQHAVDQLREAGLVVTRAGKGTFVVAVTMLQGVRLGAGADTARPRPPPGPCGPPRRRHRGSLPRRRHRLPSPPRTPRPHPHPHP